MPIIHCEEGYAFRFYSNENKEGPHIHVVGKGGEMKVWLVKNFEITPSGYGIHWEELDEDISVKAFVEGL